jgi:hypothetical protein
MHVLLEYLNGRLLLRVYSYTYVGHCQLMCFVDDWSSITQSILINEVHVRTKYAEIFRWS